MGLDIGDKKTGVAISDPLGWTAQGKTVLTTSSKQELFLEIKSLISQYEVEKIVVGLPKNMDGSVGQRAEKILELVDQMQNEFQVPVVTWDERLSTAEAERKLLAADLSRARRKEVIDKMAAVTILQSFLDNQN